MARLLRRNCSATSFLKVVSIYFLKEELFVSSILRKLSWEKFETMVDSSFEIEVVVLVVVEGMSLDFLGVFPFLFPMVGKAVILSTS